MWRGRMGVWCKARPDPDPLDNAAAAAAAAVAAAVRYLINTHKKDEAPGDEGEQRPMASRKT
jgi:hypothetical protein